jgi:competence ComEA-like helix-hairpin-helix protein
MGKHRWPISADARSSEAPAETAASATHDDGTHPRDSSWDPDPVRDGAAASDGSGASGSIDPGVGTGAGADGHGEGPAADGGSSSRLRALRTRSARASSTPYPGDDDGNGRDDDDGYGDEHGVEDKYEDEYEGGHGDRGHRGGSSGHRSDPQGGAAQPGVRWGIARSAALVFLGVALAVGGALFLVRSSEPSAAAVSVQLGSDAGAQATSAEAEAEAESGSEPESTGSSQNDAGAADPPADPPADRAAATGGSPDADSDTGTGPGHAGDGGSGGPGTADGEAEVRDAGTIVVYVTGAVTSPGVVTMPAGTRLFEILERAGGPAPDADLEGINLARLPTDGEHLHVLAVGEVPRPPSDLPVSGGSGIADTASDGAEAAPGNSAGTSSSSGVIDINTATLAEVESLPRVGPVLGQRIIEWRDTNGPFARPADIDAVPGIGPAMLEGILPLITVR